MLEIELSICPLLSVGGESLQARPFRAGHFQEERLADGNGACPRDRAEGLRQKPDASSLAFRDIEGRRVNVGVCNAGRVSHRQSESPLLRCHAPQGVCFPIRSRARRKNLWRLLRQQRLLATKCERPGDNEREREAPGGFWILSVRFFIVVSVLCSRDACVC